MVCGDHSLLQQQSSSLDCPWTTALRIVDSSCHGAEHISYRCKQSVNCIKHTKNFGCLLLGKYLYCLAQRTHMISGDTKRQSIYYSRQWHKRSCVRQTCSYVVTVTGQPGARCTKHLRGKLRGRPISISYTYDFVHPGPGVGTGSCRASVLLVVRWYCCCWGAVHCAKYLYSYFFQECQH